MHSTRYRADTTEQIDASPSGEAIEPRRPNLNPNQLRTLTVGTKIQFGVPEPANDLVSFAGIPSSMAKTPIRILQHHQQHICVLDRSSGRLSPTNTPLFDNYHLQLQALPDE